MRVKAEIRGMSGHCATGGDSAVLHAACHARWETPSSIVTCWCKCHVKMVAKGSGAKVLTPKK